MSNQVIGDNNLIMGSCHIAHDCKIGNNNIFANSTLLAGHVIVEVSPSFSVCAGKRHSVLLDYSLCLKFDSCASMQDYVHTAGAIVVHQFCHIGSFSFIGGGSVV